MRKKTVLVILLCFLFLVLLYPYQTTSIPEWRVQVVNTLDNPMTDAKIRQTWSHCREQNEEILITNNDGVVVFPARTIRKPLLLRLIKGLLDRISYFVMPHGSSVSAYASVFSAEGARTNWLRYSEGGTLEHKLIFQDYPRK